MHATPPIGLDLVGELYILPLTLPLPACSDTVSNSGSMPGRLQFIYVLARTVL